VNAEITGEILRIDGGRFPDTDIPTNHFRLGRRTDGHHCVLTSDQAECSPDYSLPATPARSARRASCRDAIL
jgi:hypothetical protein